MAEKVKKEDVNATKEFTIKKDYRRLKKGQSVNLNKKTEKIFSDLGLI